MRASLPHARNHVINACVVHFWPCWCQLSLPCWLHWLLRLACWLQWLLRLACWLQRLLRLACQSKLLLRRRWLLKAEAVEAEADAGFQLKLLTL